jgi:hypothetical protein
MSKDNDDRNLNDDLVLKGMQPLRSARDMNMRSEDPCRRYIIINNRMVMTKSEHQATAFLNISCHPKFLAIHDHPQSIAYTDDNGVQHYCTPDARVTMKDGLVIVVLVKSHREASQPDFLQMVEHIAEQMTADDGDIISIITERSYSKVQTMNCKTINWARRASDLEADYAVESIIKDMSGSITIEALLKAIDLGSRGFAAAVRAIDRGSLNFQSDQLLASDTPVFPLRI